MARPKYKDEYAEEAEQEEQDEQQEEEEQTIQQPRQLQPKKLLVKGKWEVRLLITDEHHPPAKVIHNAETGETLDDGQWKARVMNDLEKLMLLLQ